MRAALDDAALLAAMAQGDEQALTELHARHAKALFQFVYRLLGQDGDADEVVLDTLHEVWRQAGRFEARSSVRTWIFGIARHKALDRLRASGRIEWTSDEDEAVAALVDPSPTPFERLLASQEAERLSDCVDALPDAQREAFWLHIVDGLKLRELASVLMVPENTVATRVHHAKKRLRECLERHGSPRS